MTSPSLAEVADGVFAYVQPDGGWCLNNAGVVVDGDSVVVVDTAATERRALAFRAAVRTVADAPPRVVVNTHFHGDHTFGNFAFVPDAVVVAHEAARDEMAAAGFGLRGLWPDVDWGDLPLALPTLTYRDRLTLHVGRSAVELFHPGPAHTTTDTVVWIPDRSVLFAGDVVLNDVTPFCLMGSVTGTLRTIERLRALDPRVVVPGHGPVGGAEVFDETEAYLRWLIGLAAAGIRDGRMPRQVAADADLGPFSTLVDPERLVANLHRAYAEERGVVPGAPLDVAAVFAELVELNGGRPACHA